MKYTLESAFEVGDKVVSTDHAFKGVGTVTKVSFNLRVWFGFCYDVEIPELSKLHPWVREYTLRRVRPGAETCQQCGRILDECPVGF